MPLTAQIANEALALAQPDDPASTLTDFFTVEGWGRAAVQSGITARDVAATLADIMQNCEDPNAKLRAIKLIMQHSRDVLRLNAVINADKVERTITIGTGPDQVKLTQIERQLRLAQGAATQSNDLLVEADAFLAGEDARHAELAMPAEEPPSGNPQT